MKTQMITTTVMMALLLSVGGQAVHASEAAMTTTATRFHVHIENVSKPDVIKAPGGKRQGAGLSPGLWLVHAPGSPIFTAGQPDRGKGLQTQAEDGYPVTLSESLAGAAGIFSSGIFNIPVGAAKPGPIGPGGAFDFTVTAKPGQCLSFTLMFGNSNDCFFGTGDSGIALFDGHGKPVHGNITSRVTLWDAGTEANEEPGVGPHQAPLQDHPGDGIKTHEPIIPVVDRKDGFTYPTVSRTLRVTITPEP